jgi:hypothetical protein
MVWIREPECWPGAAAVGAVEYVEEKETCVVGFVGGYADAVSGLLFIFLAGVYAENGTAEGWWGGCEGGVCCVG